MQAALELLLDAGEAPTPERVKALIGEKDDLKAPELATPTVDLTDYDVLTQAMLLEAG